MDLKITVKNTYTYISKSFNLLSVPVQNKIVKQLSYERKINLNNSEEVYLLTQNAKSEGDISQYYKIPTGLLWKFYRLVKGEGCRIDLNDARGPKPTTRPVEEFFKRLNKVGAKIEERDYQKNAIEKCLRIGRGLIEHSTGAGKSILIAGIAYCVNVKTLVLCIGKEHIRQLTDDLEKMVGGSITEFGGSNKNTSGRIVVATIQSLNAFKKRDINKFTNLMKQFKCVIGDEIHLSAAQSYRQCFYFATNAYYKFGFSGTMHREDGAFIEVEGAVGPIIDKKDYTFLQENKYIVPAKFYFIDPMCVPLRGEANYWPQCSYHGIVNNATRNEKIIKICKIYQKNKKQVLVISPFRVEHGTMLEQLIPDSRFVWGEVDDNIRNRALKDFANKEFSVLIGSLKKDELIWIKDKRTMRVYLLEIEKAYNLCNKNKLSFETLSVNKEEEVEWKTITNVARFKTPKDVSMTKVITKSNHDCYVTDNHSLIGENNKPVLPVIGEKVFCPTAEWNMPNNIKKISVVDYLLPYIDNSIEVEIKLSKKITWQIKSDLRYLNNEKFGEPRSEKKAMERCKNYTKEYIAVIKNIQHYSWYEKGKYRIKLNKIGTRINAINKYYQCKIFNRRSRSKFSLPLEIKLTKQFLKLLGRFAADGCICKSVRSMYVVNIASKKFKDTKANIVGTCRPIIKNLLKDCFGNVFIEHNKGFDIRNKLAWMFFKSLGVTNDNNEKKVPDFVFNVSKKLKKKYLEGYFYGDGHYAKNKDRITFTSTSRQLIIGVYGLFKSINIKKISLSVDNRLENNRKLRYSIGVYQTLFNLKINNKGRKAYWHYGNFDKIKRIDKIKKDKYVYDLEVKDNENFICGIGIVAHNSRVYDMVINLPDVRCVILAGGGKAHNSFFQRVGRGIRNAPGKTHVDIVLFWDSHGKILMKHSKILRRYINKIESWKNNVKMLGEYRKDYPE